MSRDCIRMRRLPGGLWPWIALGVLGASPAFGQESTTPNSAANSTPPATNAQTLAAQIQQSKDNASNLVDEVLSTTAPAFVALGVSGETVTDPEGVKRFAAAILTGTDVDGKPVTGLGIQFAPTELLPGLRVNYLEYRDNYLKRALARLQLTAAYGRGDAGDAGNPERLAIGGIWVPFDTTDPFANKKLDDCLSQAFAARKKRLEEHPDTDIPVPSPNVFEKFDSILAKSLADCRQNLGRTPTRGYSAQIGFAKLFRSRDGGKGPLVGKGFAASAVMSVGLDCLFKPRPCKTEVDEDGKPKEGFGGKILLGAVFREHEMVLNPTDEKVYIDRNRQSYGGKLVAGNPTSVLIGLELLKQHATYSGLGRDNYLTYNLSVYVKISKGTWITASYGNSSGENFGKSQLFGVGFKYALKPATIGE